MDGFIEEGDVLIYLDSEGQKATGIVLGFGEQLNISVGNGPDRFDVPPHNVIEVLRRTVESSIAADEMSRVMKVQQLLLF